MKTVREEVFGFAVGSWQHEVSPATVTQETKGGWYRPS